MSKTIELTENQLENLKTEMSTQIDMLTTEEVEHLANKLNNDINLPFMTEKTENTIFVKIVIKVDRYLYNLLPNEIYKLIRDAEDGLDDKEVENLINVLSRRANDSFDIKYLPEWVEQEVFELLVGLIVGAMKRNVSILSP